MYMFIVYDHRREQMTALAPRWLLLCYNTLTVPTEHFPGEGESIFILQQQQQQQQ